MKIKRKLAVLLSTMALIGCLAAPVMASATPVSAGWNTTYYGSSLCYRGWGKFTANTPSRVGVALVIDGKFKARVDKTISKGTTTVYSGYIDKKCGTCRGVAQFW